METTQTTKEDEMRLQYQLSNGSWVDCADRTEEFLARCEKNNGPDAAGNIVPRFRAIRDLTRDEAIADLATGKTLRNDPADWYSECRDGEAAERIVTARRANRRPVEMVKCSCGHTIPRMSVMSASMGTSCPDCYDRMSD